ncbi:MAG: filamentous hemagglutinin N-terminal domain-containing protein [Nostoc sp. ChiSLP02]|nr:filamentous hemagglutinin N-terminal domain-containing protein [Nostoc sp. DedSLP05]MDZ8102344.1 filamentous hemagglutinin N-terminal domain-containing protein [Nostoc sp. DedSLP01]MDZ8188419.1 filamentous hemagglutinin N-terminal domain-containing protein [Nostoc sp. ChiSLP02]
MSSLSVIRWSVLVPILGITFSTMNCAIAQVTPDNTLPNNSSVTREGNIFNITGGMSAGRNLFHSFSEFSVPTGGVASFNNAIDIQNIISRVTGGSTSNIDGLIKTNGTANLFLINPNGIIFGKNAELNIGGSFVTTTASAMEFGNQGVFSATNPESSSSLLSVNPSALLFNQIKTAFIENNSVGLDVPNGNSLLLVGGDINMDGGGLFAFDGRIELGGSSGGGKVGLQLEGNNLHLSFPNDVALADILLTNRAILNASGEGGGYIQVQGRDVTLKNNSAIFADTLRSKNGRGIFIRAEQLNIEGGSSVNANTFSSGVGGNVSIKTGRLLVREGGRVSSSTLSAGEGGALEVTTTESVEIIGMSVLNSQSYESGDAGDLTIQTRQLIVRDEGQVSSTTYGAGNAGDLTIQTEQLIVRDGGQVVSGTFGEGFGGALTVNASDSIELIGTEPEGRFTRGLITQSDGTGDARDLTITTGKLIVRDGARVSSATTNQGKSGDIQVNAFKFVNLSGVGSFGFSSGLFASTSGVGQGGNITVDTSAFQVANGAVLSAKTVAEGNSGNITVNANTFEAVNGGQVLTNTRSRGRTGNIILNATNSITLSGSDSTYADRLSQFGSNFINNEGAESGLFASNNSRVSVKGGDIFVNARILNVQDSAKIAVNNLGTGRGGNIQIQAGNLTLKNQALISAETFSSQGGNIEIGLKGILLLRQSSRISTNAGTAQQPGNGGNIAINAPSGFIVAVPSENSDITANAFTGKGGRIDIKVNGIYGIQFRESPTLFSDITASSEFGIQGTVELNTPDIDPNSGLVELPAVPVDTEVAQGCSAGSSIAKSQFTITGRGGLPPNPGEALNTDAVQVDLVTLNPKVAQRSNTAISTTINSASPIIEATGWVISANGDVTLIASNSTLDNWQRTPDCHAFNQQSGG